SETARRDGLCFEGFLTYPSPPAAVEFLTAAVAGAEAAGLEVRSVSAGGTPSMWHAEAPRPTRTRDRRGPYPLYDRTSVGAGAASLDDVAMTVRATVVSRLSPTRAILDAGSKALAFDPSPAGGHGLILEAPQSAIVNLNEEHGYVDLAPGDSLELG